MEKLGYQQSLYSRISKHLIGGSLSAKQGNGAVEKWEHYITRGSGGCPSPLIHGICSRGRTRRSEKSRNGLGKNVKKKVLTENMGGGKCPPPTHPHIAQTPDLLDGGGYTML